MRVRLLLLALVLAGCVAPTATDDPILAPDAEEPAFEPDLARAVGDLRRLGWIPPVPGFPEGIHLWNDTVFVGTIPYDHPGEPGVLYLLDRATGEIREEIAVEGEDMSAGYRGLSGFTVDGRGRPYAGGLSTFSVLRWTLTSEGWRQETYATLPDLPSCVGVAGPCSPTPDDREPLPNDLVFDDAGNLYVTDSFQATIWRVPPGGGEATIWFQDPRLADDFGPNGIRITPDGKSVVFDITGPYSVGVRGALRDLPLPDALGPDGLVVYRLPLVDAPRPEDLRVFHWFEPASIPDGLTFGASGNLYVSLLGRNQVAVIAPDGSQIARLPSPHERIAHDPPMEFPASLVFDDARRSLLVTNYATLYVGATGDRSVFAVLDLVVDDVSAPMARPLVD